LFQQVESTTRLELEAVQSNEDKVTNGVSSKTMIH
jgi:hypothetical protein